MYKKLIFSLGALMVGISASAQTMEERSEMPETCVTAPATLNEESSELNINLECQVFNYELKVANASGEEVFYSKIPTEKWNAASAAPGVYTWTLLGTIGSTVDYTHVKHIAEVTVE